MWSPCTFYLALEEGLPPLQFASVGQWLAACKAHCALDTHALERIMTTSSMQEIVHLDYAIVPPEDWDLKLLHFTVMGNHAKFSQDAQLRHMLLKTVGWEDTLVYGSSNGVWGIGLGDSVEVERWRGMNLLGQALKEVWLQLTRRISAMS